jgi:hypothetical protein
VSIQVPRRSELAPGGIPTMGVNDNAGCLDERGALDVFREQARSYRIVGRYTAAFRGSLTGPDSIASPGAFMTSPTQPPVADALSDDQADLPDSVDSSADSETKAAIAAFKFPFKPGELAAAKNASQPWYKNGAKNGHTKTPGAAPPGTRRSMGKR